MHELVDELARAGAPRIGVHELDEQREHVEVVRRARIRRAVVGEATRRIGIVRLDRDAARQIAPRLGQRRRRDRGERVEVAARLAPGVTLVRDARALVKRLVGERRVRERGE